ncbi:MAG: tetratricopeptide repeat protein [Rhodothermales bacterium]
MCHISTKLAGKYAYFLCACCVFILAHLTPGAAAAQERLAYTYKARNLQPIDFGYEDGSWEKILRKMNGRMDESPDNPELLLQRAIAYREYGVRRALVLRKRDWKRSRQDFDALLAKDSTFQDVLFHYGILKRYQGDFDQALRLLHRQLEIDEHAVHVSVALFRLYHQFLHEKDAQEVGLWLTNNPSEYASFFEAELLRTSGQLKEADAKLSAVLKTARSLPLQPVLLSRARVYYALKEHKIAESFVKQAVDIIGSETDAWLVLEDFKYILNDFEVQNFFEARTPAAYRSFFAGVINERNPARSEEVDLRMLEHFRRLLEAEEKYAFYEAREAYRVSNNVRGDKMADNDFPLAYWLNGAFGDKGLIFIRHGEPANIVASVNEATSFLESWRYRSPKLDFHFEGHGQLAELVPTLPLDMDVLEARESWGGTYTRLASAMRVQESETSFGRSRQLELDFIAFGNELFDQSLEYVHSGLTSDRHKWSETTLHLPLPYFVASFQDASNATSDTTEVEIYFSVPIGTVSEALKGRDRLGIEVGLSVHDQDWNEVYTSFEKLNVDASRAKDAVAVDYIRFEAVPDSYHVNLHARITDTDWIGSYQFEYEVPDYSPGSSGRTLLISDLVPAFEVTPMDRPSRYAKKGLYLRSNPGRGYRPEDPFFIYFEIYNLTYADNDLTNFEITYILQPPGGKGKRKGLFRRGSGDPLLSLTYERTSEELNLAEYGEIDMSAVPAGQYELKVVVVDKNTGATTSNTRVIELG